LYYILTTVYKGKNIFTNLIHVTTKTTRSIMATVLEKTLTAIYAVLSFSVQKRINTIIIVLYKLNLNSR
jgi:hypothetical protein